MKRSIAFFDFDGTITSHDTLLELIKYSKGALWFYLGFLINSPFIIAYKAGIISNQKAKEKILRFFFGNIPLDLFRQKCEAFAVEVLPGLIRPSAKDEIIKLQQAGAEIVIVSASACYWIGKWSEPKGIKLITTRLETKNGMITGNIEGNNCHGQEKVRRIQEQYDLSAYDEIYCYGDSKGDQPMLALGNHKFYKPFR